MCPAAGASDGVKGACWQTAPALSRIMDYPELTVNGLRAARRIRENNRPLRPNTVTKPTHVRRCTLRSCRQHWPGMPRLWEGCRPSLTASITWLRGSMEARLDHLPGRQSPHRCEPGGFGTAFGRCLGTPAVGTTRPCVAFLARTIPLPLRNTRTSDQPLPTIGRTTLSPPMGACSTHLPPMIPWSVSTP